MTKSKNADAFGRRRPVSVSFPEFEDELIKQFTSPSAPAIDKEIKAMAQQVDSVAAMVDEWDYKSMDDRDLRRVLVKTEELSQAHTNLLQQCSDCIKVDDQRRHSSVTFHLVGAKPHAAGAGRAESHLGRTARSDDTPQQRWRKIPAGHDGMGRWWRRTSVSA